LCDEYPCKKYDGADLTDSFITHKNQFHDFDRARSIGLEAYEAELDEKVVLLEELLKNYNDGRRKSLFCVAVNLLDLKDVKTVMDQLADKTEPQSPQKIKAAAAVRLFEEMAENRGISLKLRK